MHTQAQRDPELGQKSTEVNETLQRRGLNLRDSQPRSDACDAPPSAGNCEASEAAPLKWAGDEIR